MDSSKTEESPQEAQPSMDDVHESDKALVAYMPIQAIAALRRRRAIFAAVVGPVTAGRLKTGFMLSYAAPSFSTVPLTMLISVYVIQFYEVLGASLSMLAFFQALARSFDVVSDPLMSYWTDSVRSKHGRRRPFLVTGCVPYGICLVMLLTPGLFTTTEWDQKNLINYMASAGTEVWRIYFFFKNTVSGRADGHHRP